MKTIHESEVAVIGAGAIGCSIAYRLSSRGITVIVIDSGSICAGTSSATLGVVWVQSKEPVEYMELNLAGSLLHTEYAEKHEEIEFQKPGGIVPCLNENDLEDSRKRIETLNAANSDFNGQFLSPEEILALESCISKNILGGTFCPHDGHLDPIRLVYSLAHEAAKNGTAFLLHAPVHKIEINQSGLLGVMTPDGLVRSRHVVVAAGIWTNSLTEPLGLHLPMVLDRGEILVSEQMPTTLNHPTIDIRQTAAGNFLIGSSHEQAEFNTSTTVSMAGKMSKNAILVIPALKNALIIRQFAGIRPMPVDGLPYLGATESVPGLFIAVSHSGITLAHVHGKVISELIIDGQTDIPISNYRPERYKDIPISDIQIKEY